MAQTAAPVTLTRANSTRISGGTLGRTIRGRPPLTRPGSGIASAATVAAMPSAMKITNGSTSGPGAHCARTPATIGPAALPPAWASAANSAARSSSGAGSSSTSAAAAAPLIIPTARPCTARAANSHARLLASANSASPSVAVVNPTAITRRRPRRSESWPNTSRDGARTSAYVAKTSVSTALENPNSRS